MHAFQGCPGSMMMDRRKQGAVNTAGDETVASRLRQWPIQLHLISPTAPYYQNADVLLTADCVAYALGNYHPKHLKAKAIAIACPKLDEGQDVYVEKVRAWIDEAHINTLTVMIMEVPCCMGLAMIAERALAAAQRKVPVKRVVVGLDGEIRGEEWIVA